MIRIARCFVLMVSFIALALPSAFAMGRKQSGPARNWVTSCSGRQILQQNEGMDASSVNIILGDRTAEIRFGYQVNSKKNFTNARVVVKGLVGEPIDYTLEVDGVPTITNESGFIESNKTNYSVTPLKAISFVAPTSIFEEITGIKLLQIAIPADSKIRRNNNGAANPPMATRATVTFKDKPAWEFLLTCLDTLEE